MTNGRTAEELARVACDILESNAQSAINFAHAYGAPEGRIVVIDGSQYSPSTRAVPYGSVAWGMGADDWQTFDDTVCDFVDSLELEDPDGDVWPLEWDEGCLFANAPTFED